MSRPDPFAIPEWQAIGRECKLIRQLIGSGVTALGNANYADKKGEYYVAFFGLSIGLERLCKIILVSDYAIENNGRLPEQNRFRQFGHKLEELLDTVSAIENKYSFSLRYPRPTGAIEAAIVQCLDSFADARRGRYSNFDAIGDPNLGEEFEPIRRWWTDVAEKILQANFYGKKVEKQVQMMARFAQQLMGPYSLVLHTAEDGTRLNEIEAASYRTGSTSYVQKYGRYHSLLIIRWLAHFFDKLSHYGCYQKDIDVLFGHYEHFQTYTVTDDFLKTRKRWPL